MEDQTNADHAGRAGVGWFNWHRTQLSTNIGVRPCLWPNQRMV